MAVTAADLQIKFSSDTKGAEAGIDRMGSKVKGLGGVMKTALGTAGGFLLGGAVQNLVGGFGQLVKGGLDFEAQMANVNSIAQLSDSQIKTLSASVNSLATETAQAPQVLAAGLYDIYSSGFQGAEALDILGVAAKGATAGMTDTATSSRALVGVLNSGIDDLAGNALDAQGAMDILFKTVELGVITFPELANNMAQTLAPANALGISLEELGAAYALMTKSAIPAAQAETAFANLMKVATNPTDELTAAVNDFGYESAYALVQAEGMPGLLNAMAKATGGNAEELRKLIPDAEAYNAALVLLGEDGGQTYLDMLEEMDKAAGATDKALTKQSKSAAFAMKQAKVAAQQAATVFIGALSPAIQVSARGLAFLVTEGLTPALEWFGRILDPIGRFAGLLREALGSGQGVDDLFNVLFGPGAAFAGAPQILQDAARELLNIADALGDVFAAFRAGGLAGVGDVIGEEVSNILDSLKELASIALPVVIDTTVEIVGELLDLARMGWNAFASYAGYGNEARDATNATASLEPFDTVDVLIDGTVKLIGDLGDIANSITRELDLQRSSGQLASAQLEGVAIGREIGDAILDGVFRGMDESSAGATPDPGFFDAFLAPIMPASWGGDLEMTVYDEWNLKAIGIAYGIVTGISDGLTTGLQAITMLSGLPGGGGPLANIKDLIRNQFVDVVADAFTEIPDDIEAAVGVLEIVIDAPTLPPWIRNVAAFIAPVLSFAEGLLLAGRTFLDGWNFFQDAISRRNQDAAPEPTGGAMGLNWMPSGMQLPAFPQDEFFNQGQATPVEVPVDVKPVANSVDWSVIQDAINPFGSGFGTGGDSPFGGMAFTANLDLDKSAFDVGVQTAQSLGQTFDSTTYMSTFDADNGPAALAYTAAYGWGNTWDAARFASTFDIDNGPAAVAYTEAFGWGNAWAAQTFTASFAVDTSGITGAVEVARRAAQDIADLLPNSPAKKGPLSTMPNFDYIADAARSTFDGMGRDAERGLSALSDRYGRGAGGAWGAGASGVTINVTAPIQGPIYGINDFEDKVETMFMGPLQQALILAYERQRRANGER